MNQPTHPCTQASFHRGFLCWTYASRLLATGCFFLVAVYLNALATMIATHRNPYAMLLDRSGEPLRVHTLPDLGHDLWAFFLNRCGAVQSSSLFPASCAILVHGHVQVLLGCAGNACFERRVASDEYEVLLQESHRKRSAHVPYPPCPPAGTTVSPSCPRVIRLGHHTDYIDEHALPDRMVSFAGSIGNLFILCHPQRLKIMRRVFIIFGTVRTHGSRVRFS